MPNQYDGYVLLYTLVALIEAIVPTYLWNSVFKSDTSLNYGGYKFAAYGSSYAWFPLAAVSLIHILWSSSDLDSALVSTAKASLAGPFGANVIGIVLLYLSDSAQMTSSAALGFYVYTFTLIAFQVVTLPKLNQWHHREFNHFFKP